MRSIMQERITAMGRAQMTMESESTAKSGSEQLAPDLLQGMATIIGVSLTPERAAALATQAAPHFAILRALDTFVDPTGEPAAVFRLTAEESGA